MTTVTDTPHLTEDGVAFSVAVGFMKRACLIPKHTLCHLCRSWGEEVDCMHVFRDYEDAILSVARRLAVAGAAGTPIILERKYFH